jgi:hypothetical protein
VLASDLQLTFADGRVTLVADDVTAREILQRWAEIGESQVVNAERLGGPPLTLRLDQVPERDALGILLRSAAGYVVAPRPEGKAGTSRFDRILVLAVSTAPPASRPSVTSPAPVPFSARPGDSYVPAEWPPLDDSSLTPPQLQPYPGPFPGTVPTQPEHDPPTQPRTSPQPGFLPEPVQPQQPVLTLPPMYPTAPPPGSGG